MKGGGTGLSLGRLDIEMAQTKKSDGVLNPGRDQEENFWETPMLEEGKHGDD